MKKEIIYTDDYALIVSDEKIKPLDWCINANTNSVFQFYTKRGISNNDKKIIGHRPLKDAPILKGVPLLPEFSQEDDVEKKSRDFVKYVGGSQEQRLAFIDGYLEAKETYKYTEEDLRKAFTAGLMNRYSRVGEAVAETEFVQSLQQPKRPKSILLETVGNDEMINKCKNFNLEIGCVALNCTCENLSKPKNTTNSKGQTELVGKYIY